MDFIYNGQATGDVATTLMAHNFDPNCLRPWLGNDGRTYITQNVGGKFIGVPVNNATATLRKDDWIQMDKAIVKAAQPRLRLVTDLRSMGLDYTIPNGMGKTVLETETQSDISDAIMSMDGLRESDSDRPVFELNNLPLPIIHKDFFFSARQVMASRNGGSPLDMTTGELASRKVAESAEKLACGVASTYAFGGGTIYGMMNYPQRLTKSLTALASQTGATLVSEILEMKQQSIDAYHYGPWMLYCSNAWNTILDDDYSAAKGDNTTRERIKKIEGIVDVKTLDYLTGNTILLVQMTSDVIREVVGMDITTVQWQSHGGMRLNFKVMAIMVPQLRSDINSRTGIVHGTAA